MRNRHVLITGGTGALGAAVTQAVLAREPAQVHVTFVVDEEADRLRSSLAAVNDRLHLTKVDLTNESAVSTLVGSLAKVEVLLHLVGGFTMGPTDAFESSWFHAHIELNLGTTFLVCKHVFSRMRQQGYGRIVTVGSRAAVEPGAQQAAYASAKAGVVALTRVLAQEARGMDVTANSVLPSVIDTPQNRAAMGSARAHEWVRPESLAEVICFLGSESARDLRGVALPVYGNA